MKVMLKNWFAVWCILMCAVGSGFSKQVIVKKDGSGQYLSIAEAIVDAECGDSVVVIDGGVFEEQVDVYRKRDVAIVNGSGEQNRPVISFRDNVNTGPLTYGETLDTAGMTSLKNGALRILGSRNILVDGFVIDGVTPYPFGADGVWEQRYAQQRGSNGVVLYKSGNVTIRNCEIKNAYSGLYIYEVDDALFELIEEPFAPVSVEGFGGFGDHLIEYNSIHDNSYGFFIERQFGLGSTFRYNRIYENHHESASFAAMVKNMTSEGGNQPGGAFVFKENVYTPSAVYNNTLWHNGLLFSDNWKGGTCQLMFNNIVGSPVEYWGQSDLIFGEFMEGSQLFENRMFNCVYAAQQQAPTESYVTVTNELKPAKNGSGGYEEGALINPFPAVAGIRWIETSFHSTDPADADFLEPDWDNSLVQQYISDGGWSECGVRDPDGSVADLGAVPHGESIEQATVRVHPVKNVTQFNSGNLLFSVISDEGTLSDMSIEYARFVAFPDLKLEIVGDIFGANGDPIETEQIHDVQLSGNLRYGLNSLDYEIQGLTEPPEYGFFELMISGVDRHGVRVTSTPGFVLYYPVQDTCVYSIRFKNSTTGEVITSAEKNDDILIEVVTSEPSENILPGAGFLRTNTGGYADSVSEITSDGSLNIVRTLAVSLVHPPATGILSAAFVIRNDDGVLTYAEEVLPIDVKVGIIHTPESRNRFAGKAAGSELMTIYNLSGRKVAHLSAAQFAAGQFTRKLPKGTYIAVPGSASGAVNRSLKGMHLLVR